MLSKAMAAKNGNGMIANDVAADDLDKDDLDEDKMLQIDKI